MAVSERKEFPFSAVAGQDQFKLALILAAINPLIGGVLVSGPRGSAKSTLARGIAGILPQDDSGVDAAFTTLPLGASEERLLGTLDLQQVLNDKKVAFHPGLLSKAHGGVLYVDEVNLLADNLVDQLLDVAASGVNRVERDGISHEHDARFLLVGTMNPDEGELRPQLQDRFGLMVQLTNQYTLDERMQIVQLREKFDNDAVVFCEAFRFKQKNLRQSIQVARTQLKKVTCSDAIRMEIAQRCHLARVDGVRADIVWVRAAMAHSVWRGSSQVGLQDVDKVEELVLAHRRQTPPSSGQPQPPSENRSHNPPHNDSAASSRRPADSHKAMNTAPKGESDQDQKEGDWGSMNVQSFISETLVKRSSKNEFVSSKKTLKPPFFNFSDKRYGGKEKGLSSGGQRPNLMRQGDSVDWFTTVIKSPYEWPPRKLHYQSRKLGRAMLHFILLDTSASTVGQAFLKRGKEAILAIAEHAYLRREEIAILGFGNNQVVSLLPKMRAPKELSAQLSKIQAGGGTPLKMALVKASEQLIRWQRNQPELQSHVYLVTDGRTSLESISTRFLSPCSVLDTEVIPVKRGRAEQLAHCLGAQYFLLKA